ncbi:MULTISPECIES: ATP-grasp domain-containing protein [unclassified Burkholderia]|uniref:ATP-grasp domain-containing protein n=1 Tax=unclassified Burkholderia TaxID=2613784 RepID=UPI002AB03055|nr:MULTISPECIES: ATP-grasp domain-containing protein [unclassified Burkholderia]
MSRPYNVLVFPAGEINSAEVHAALSSQVNIKLFGACSVERFGHHIFSNYNNTLPNIGAAEFLPKFNALLEAWDIDLIIPTHDTVVEYMVQMRGQIARKCLIPSENTAAACRDKKVAYLLFADCTFTPRVFESLGDVGDAPVFVKPARGQGSVGARLIKAGEAAVARIHWDNEVVCEYLPGDELTVDCFTDRHRRLLGVFPRTRERTLGGISIAGTAIEASDEIMKIASTINDRLEFLGMWYLQLKRSVSGEWKLLEISARCAGSQNLTRARGVNLPLLSVYAAMGRDVAVQENPYRVRMDRTLTNRYDINYEYDTAYVDYDDTITCPSGVNVDIVRLLYQMRNDGKKIVLMTRHEYDLETSLKNNAISEDLFAEIVHLKNGEPKADFIRPGRAVFIDNAYAERCAVQAAHGIPVFDVDTTEVLQKWIK